MTAPFWHIGNHYINPEHIISIEYKPSVAPIMDSFDPRVIDGRARWSERFEEYVDEDGDIISKRPSKLVITTTELVAWDSCPHGEQYNGVTAVSGCITLFGAEADALNEKLASASLSVVRAVAA